MRLKMEELKSILAQVDTAKTPADRRALMVQAKVKERELGQATIALEAADARIQVQSLSMVATSVTRAAPSRQMSRPIWRYPQGSKDITSQGFERFMNVESPETYVIEVSDDDEDMEDLEL